MNADIQKLLTQRLDMIIREISDLGVQHDQWVHGASPERELLDQALDRYLHKAGKDALLDHLVLRFPWLERE